MSDMRLALTLSLNDRLVAPLRRALDEVEKHLQEVERDFKAVGDASQQASRTMAATQGPQQAAKDVASLARNTQNAVGLAERLREAWTKAGNMVKGVSSAMAGYQAAKFVLAEPLQKQRSYERELADASNTAYAGKTLPEKQQGMKTLDAAVTTSLRVGGGKREDALGALNDMIASGTVDVDQATKLLPTVMKYATAGKADPKEIANIAVKALQNGFTLQDVPLMLDKALAAGQAGGFELKDMAKWLPSLLAMGKQAGMSGMKGYERILASAQAAVITSGTKDEAGNNLKDLLQHVSSHALQTSAKRMGIDAAGTLAKSIGEGDDTLTSLVKLSDYVANKDPRFVALQKKLESAPTKKDSAGRPVYSEEQQGIMKQQADLLQGSAIGQLFHNQQSVLALVAERNNRKYIQDVLATTGRAHGQVGQENFDLVAGTNDFKMQQADNEKLFAQTGALGPLNNAMGKLSESTTDLYRKFPLLGEAIEGTSLLVKTVAAIVTAMSGIAAIFALKGMGATAAAAAGAGAAAAPAAAAAATGAATAGGAAAAGGAAVGAGEVAAGGAASTAAAAGSLAAGATVGSVVLGGLALTSAATNIVAANAEALQNSIDDTGLAANIVLASQQGQVDREAETYHRGAGFEDPRRLDNVDIKEVLEELKKPREVLLKIDAPEFLTVQQIGNQVARDGRRGM